MCDGVALAYSDLPEALIVRQGLKDRIRRRSPDADPELWFLYRDKRPVLPVWWDRELVILTWSNQDRRCPLPRTSCIKLAELEQGIYRAVRVEIPARLALDCGIWYQVNEALEGVLLRDENGAPHVYVLTEPASHYYRIMTRSEFMPKLVGQRI